jgi:hypothetical protein
VDVRTEDFQELVGEDLSGVTFVRHYLQLQFNPPPLLNAYTPVTVLCGDQRATIGEDTFPNLLLGQLDKFVRGVQMRPEIALEIAFDDGSLISISLRPEHYVGAEAVNLHRKNREMIVV